MRTIPDDRTTLGLLPADADLNRCRSGEFWPHLVDHHDPVGTANRNADTFDHAVFRVAKGVGVPRPDDRHPPRRIVVVRLEHNRVGNGRLIDALVPRSIGLFVPSLSGLHARLEFERSRSAKLIPLQGSGGVCDEDRVVPVTINQAAVAPRLFLVVVDERVRQVDRACFCSGDED